MAKEPMELPTGVEFVGKSIRIRFSWNKKRHCETLPLPQTPKGIAAAEALRSQVTQLAKLAVLNPETYRELFPNSRSDSTGQMPIFFDYAQDWLNSLQIEDSTRKNYRSTIQNYWVPHLAEYPPPKNHARADAQNRQRDHMDIADPQKGCHPARYQSAHPGCER
ncbi:DUF3596 domain-containing protein [Pseudomonas sp.]|uniref:Arm DNA-binding domain-containing protein n=1 Tax=Pseudomonas sp. TaxID=306 RepID=UPI00258C61A6|nr:DUF3596 domain-containing protein [Pseudomonas sp.]